MSDKHTWGDAAYPWGSFTWGGIAETFPSGVLLDTKHFHAKRKSRDFRPRLCGRTYNAKKTKHNFCYILEGEWDE